jgi:hypothetical protein
MLASKPTFVKMKNKGRKESACAAPQNPVMEIFSRGILFLICRVVWDSIPGEKISRKIRFRVPGL